MMARACLFTRHKSTVTEPGGDGTVKGRLRRVYNKEHAGALIFLMYLRGRSCAEDEAQCSLREKTSLVIGAKKGSLTK
jgi:hypothetical protein